MTPPALHSYDAIVLGLGAMGSAALYHLARRGIRALGIERFGIPNEMGSSHGVTRMVRLAYHEDSSYVPLARRSLKLWRELEAGSGKRLFFAAGSIDAGPTGDEIFVGSRQSCEEHGLPHEVLTGREVNQRYPGYSLPEDHKAVLQPDGGVLLSEECIVAHVGAAMAFGAEVHIEEQVLSWRPDGEGIAVETDRGRYVAARLVVCAGAWIGKLMPELHHLLEPERQVVAWLRPVTPHLFQPDVFPVFNIAVEEGRCYGLPEFGAPGVKVGRYHHLEQRGDPDAIDRETHAEDEALLRRFTSRYLPMAAGPTLSMKVCLFTLSPDEHFILDTMPDTPQVAVAAGFSGHGFKFSSVVGEIMADLVQNGSTPHNIGMFRLSRFTA